VVNAGAAGAGAGSEPEAPAVAGAHHRRLVEQIEVAGELGAAIVGARPRQDGEHGPDGVQPHHRSRVAPLPGGYQLVSHGQSFHEGLGPEPRWPLLIATQPGHQQRGPQPPLAPLVDLDGRLAGQDAHHGRIGQQAVGGVGIRADHHPGALGLGQHLGDEGTAGQVLGLVDVVRRLQALQSLSQHLPLLAGGGDPATQLPRLPLPGADLGPPQLADQGGGGAQGGASLVLRPRQRVLEERMCRHAHRR